VFAGSLAGLTQLFVALFTVFFFLRDFDYFRSGLISLLPLSKADSHAVLERVQQTIDASLRGRVLIAMLQGGLGGLMFWLLGLPAPLLWGTVMTLFALVPMLGAFIVWVPAALFLALTGHPGKALVLALWGTLVIGVADNLLYPVLVGRGIRLHTIWIFFAVLGGVAAFGASGLVVGPVIFAIADALIEVWTRRTTATAA
jgi:predicted PurR-regulated permease PerM